MTRGNPKSQTDKIMDVISSKMNDPVKKIFMGLCVRAGESPDHTLDRLDLAWWICMTYTYPDNVWYPSGAYEYLRMFEGLGLITLVDYDDQPQRYQFEQDVIDAGMALGVARELETTS